MTDSPYVRVDDEVLNAVANGWYHSPHDVLGPHIAEDCVTVRTIRRLADSVFIETAEGRTEAVHEWGGIWRAVLPGTDIPDYRVVAVYGDVEKLSDDL